MTHPARECPAPAPAPYLLLFGLVRGWCSQGQHVGTPPTPPHPPHLGTALEEQDEASRQRSAALSLDLGLSKPKRLFKEGLCGAPVSWDKVLSWGIPSLRKWPVPRCGCPYLLQVHVPNPGNRLWLQGSGLDLGTRDQAQRCVQSVERAMPSLAMDEAVRCFSSRVG